MKKLIIAAAIVCAAVVSHGAACTWSAYNTAEFLNENGASWTGTATLACTALDFSQSVSIEAGWLWVDSLALESETLTDYTWTLSATSGEYTYSNTTIGQADDMKIGLADFNSAGTWTKTPGPGPEPEPTPEPTSAMLMLLGVAGLALKRKQK